jgi:hypothetical protein
MEQPKQNSPSSVHWSVVPSQTSSPYVHQLTERLEAHGVAIKRMSLRELLRSRRQVVHIHWPEHVSHGGGRAQTAAKGARSLLILAVCRMRDHRIVLTAHNIEPHLASNRVDRTFRRGVERIATMIHVMVPEHVGELEESGVANVQGRAVVIRHLIGRAEHPPPPNSSGPLVALGLIASYHQPVEFVEALGAAGSKRPVVIAGSVGEAETADRLATLASTYPWLDYRPGFLPEPQLMELIGTASAMVALQRSPFNSGTPAFAIPLGLPVIMTASSSSADMARTIGAAWVHEVPKNLTDLDLQELEDFLGAARPLPDLDHHDPDLVARQHIDMYANALHNRRNASTS